MGLPREHLVPLRQSCIRAISPPLETQCPSLRWTLYPNALPIIRLAQVVSLSQSFPDAQDIECEEGAQAGKTFLIAHATLDLVRLRPNADNAAPSGDGCHEGIAAVAHPGAPGGESDGLGGRPRPLFAHADGRPLARPIGRRAGPECRAPVGTGRRHGRPGHPHPRRGPGLATRAGARAARQSLLEQIAQWKTLSAAGSSAKFALLAHELADRQADLGPAGRHDAAELAIPILQGPLDPGTVDTVEVIGCCEKVLQAAQADSASAVAAALARRADNDLASAAAAALPGAPPAGRIQRSGAVAAGKLGPRLAAWGRRSVAGRLGTIGGGACRCPAEKDGPRG